MAERLLDQPIPLIVPGDPPIHALYMHWKLSWKERLMVFFTGKLWHSTWGTKPVPTSIGAGSRFAPFKTIAAVEAMKAASDRKH